MNDLTHDRESEAGPLDVACLDVLHAGISVEDLLELLRRNAHPVIRDGERHGPIGALGPDLDGAAARRVFDGVAQEVRDDLREPVGVAHKLVQPRIEVELDRMIGRAHPELRRGFRHDLIQIDGLGVKRHPAGFHAVEIEHVGDEAREAAGVFVDVVRVLPHLRYREVVVTHHLAEPLDPRERRPELVTHDGYELAP